MIRDDEILLIQQLIDITKILDNEKCVVTLENPSLEALDYFKQKGYTIEAVPIDDYYTNDDYYNIRW